MLKFAQQCFLLLIREWKKQLTAHPILGIGMSAHRRVSGTRVSELPLKNKTTNSSATHTTELCSGSCSFIIKPIIK